MDIYQILDEKHDPKLNVKKLIKIHFCTEKFCRSAHLSAWELMRYIIELSTDSEHQDHQEHTKSIQVQSDRV